MLRARDVGTARTRRREPDAGREEGENELVGRVRTWIASVFDEVEDRVIIAVTHSDWIKLAMHDLGVDKSWLVPRNNEMLPVIVEDTRPKPIEKR